MNELVARFVGRDAYVYTMNSDVAEGTITEVKDNWVIVTHKNGPENVINLEYVTKIVEKPSKKKKN